MLLATLAGCTKVSGQGSKLQERLGISLWGRGPLRIDSASEVGRISGSVGVSGAILGSYPQRATKLMRGSGDALG
jgi:hypothetical protein